MAAQWQRGDLALVETTSFREDGNGCRPRAVQFVTVPSMYLKWREAKARS